MSDSDWFVQLTPYVWLPSVETSSRSVGALPPMETQTDLLDVLDVAAEAALEVRKNRVFLLLDLSYVDLSGSQGFDGVVFDKGETEVSGILGSANLGYRVIEEDPFIVDLMAGVQVVSLEIDLDFKGAVPASASTSDTLIDPIVGARARLNLGSGFFLNAIGDIGGGVDSKLTWQAMGTVGWQANDWLAFQLGYRHLEIDFKDSSIMENLTLTGPIFGASFRL
ncbi:MAG: hypothetical protein WD044_05410 [Dongiaceae bacterium]